VFYKLWATKEKFILEKHDFCVFDGQYVGEILAKTWGIVYGWKANRCTQLRYAGRRMAVADNFEL